MPLQQQRPSYMKELSGDLIDVFGADLLTQIQVAPDGDDPDEGRRRLAELLAAKAGEEREPLDQLRSHFMRRLHQTSDDFPATAGLRVTEAALSLVPYPAGLWAGRQRASVRRFSRRWRRRPKSH
jgi:hypothetical protein